MDLLTVAQSVSIPEVDYSPMIALFVWATLLGVLGLLVAIAGLLAAVAAIGAAVLVTLAVATAVAHLLLAVLILISRPATYVLVHKRWWALAALPAGLVAAVPYFALHYRPGIRPRCHGCGYARRGVDRWPKCPECGTAASPQLLSRI